MIGSGTELIVNAAPSGQRSFVQMDIQRTRSLSLDTLLDWAEFATSVAAASERPSVHYEL